MTLRGPLRLAAACNDRRPLRLNYRNAERLRLRAAAAGAAVAAAAPRLAYIPSRPCRRETLLSRPAPNGLVTFRYLGHAAPAGVSALRRGRWLASEARVWWPRAAHIYTLCSAGRGYGPTAGSLFISALSIVWRRVTRPAVSFEGPDLCLHAAVLFVPADLLIPGPAENSARPLRACVARAREQFVRNDCAPFHCAAVEQWPAILFGPHPRDTIIQGALLWFLSVAPLPGEKEVCT